MSFHFHPAVAQWIEQTFGSPTEPQSRGWPEIQAGRHVLISAPTGSGKTLAAFLASLDVLFREGIENDLPDETQIVYVSPLKALSNDIRKNLQEPLAGIRALVREMTGHDIDVRAEVRTGDTTAKQRLAIAKKPPHILVTTPESLYLLLTSESGRRVLRTTRAVILDEIHAVADDRRGAHLALSIERLEALVCSGTGFQPVRFNKNNSSSPRNTQAGSPRHCLQRIGLSATQKPIEEVARFLVGTNSVDKNGKPDCAIIDVGHIRKLDVAIELPKSPLEAVMSNEIWEEVYHCLAGLIQAHRTTLVFVNTRRLAERATMHLSELLGADAVMSHHGSLSAKTRLEAEDRLKRGELKALVATASLELGIDIGSVDLVCQLGTTRSIATFLQRVGRAEHRRSGLPKGRIFPLTRDELVECTAMLRAVARGELDKLIIPEKPLDVLAQQIVAAAATEDWDENHLFDSVRCAWPYRRLTRDEFSGVVQMLAEGFSTKRGRRGALIHHDAINHRLRGRKGARLVALVNGGAIPANADYRVILEPAGTFIGTVNEDFAVESMAGEIFQLGNASWKILKIESGQMRVEDAHGQPPGIPFWLGEAPARTNELSRAVSDLRSEIETRIPTAQDLRPWLVEILRSSRPSSAAVPAAGSGTVSVRVSASSGETPPELAGADACATAAAEQIADYYSAVHRALGVLPSQETLVMERFFDESGGMQLVIHSPFGNRINRAWGLALRKRFCRSFNFELQAAATDDAIVISLGTQHSFPLEDVFRFLNSKTVRGVLIQALLDAPMFAIRWRWNASRALAVPRQRGGKRTPAPLQRMESENLLAAVFPDQLACLENIVGDREIPDHPLVQQTIDDCLTEAMDIDGLEEILRKIETGKIRCLARDLPEPSPLASEIINARPYAFLDNAPLEERRTQAVLTRRASEVSGTNELGILDATAIERVQTEAWPTASNADELHDALMLIGWMTEAEMARLQNTDFISTGLQPGVEPEIALRAVSTASSPTKTAEAAEGTPAALATGLKPGANENDLESSIADGNVAKWLDELAKTNRATSLNLPAKQFWLAAERLPMLQAVYPQGTFQLTALPESVPQKVWERADAIRELVRGRLEVCGPIAANQLAELFGLLPTEIETALLALEAEGFVLRGTFHPGVAARASSLRDKNQKHAGWKPAPLPNATEWCDRRLLARIHRLTINRLRAEIRPVSLHEFYRFLFAWQRVSAEYRAEGPEGMETVLEQLDGCELPLAAWETTVLPARVKDYDSHWLDRLCFSGRIGWGRLTAPQNPKARAFAPLRSSPIALYLRENLETWLQLAEAPAEIELPEHTRAVLQTLQHSGALFFVELVRRTGLLPIQVEQSLSELAALGFVTCDGFDGLRALLIPSDKRPTLGRNEGVRHRKTNLASVEFAGRWSLLRDCRSRREEASSETSQANNSLGLLKSAPTNALEKFARAFLHRYGVVFRRLLEREAFPAAWYELGKIYRRWEARGEIRGGYFVSGVSGEQFALPDAIGLLRASANRNRAMN